MKTPSGRLIFIVLAAMAIASVVISCATVCDHKVFCVTIGKPGHYVWIRNKPEFDKALRALGEGNYDIYFKLRDSDNATHPYHPPSVSLKTDKVTKSEFAKNEPPGDPHVTQRVASNSLKDISDVLAALKP